MTITLRTARPDELPALQAIELAAATRFADVGMASVATSSVIPAAQHLDAIADDRVTVALVDGALAGFILVSRHADAAHVDEVDVVREAGRRGVGRALVEHAIAWATRERFASLTLTTFRDVPWNGPFYASCGFVELAPPLHPRLAAIRADELARGIELQPRIAMARVLTARG